MLLKTSHLAMVVAIAEEGTLTAAAERLFVTQSAVSHQLGALEHQLGVQLFHRSGAGALPTAAGQRILETARPVLAKLKLLQEDLGRIARGDAGRLRVTTQCYTCYRWLPDIISSLCDDFPRVDVRIVPEAASNPIEGILAVEVDLALAYDFEADDRLATVPLFEDELVLVVAPEHPLADKDYVEAPDFADQHLFAYSGDPEDSFFCHSVLAPAGIRPARLSGVRLTEGIVSLVAAGMGVAVITRWTAAREIAEGLVRAVPLGSNGLRRSWSAVMLAETLGIPYANRFVELLREGPSSAFRTAEPVLRSAAGIRMLG